MDEIDAQLDRLAEIMADAGTNSEDWKLAWIARQSILWSRNTENWANPAECIVDDKVWG